MESALLTGGSMFDRVTVTFSRRDLLLMNLCLEVVARDHTRSGNLSSDIQSLQSRLTNYQSVANSSNKKQAGCGDDCRCASHENKRKADG